MEFPISYHGRTVGTCAAEEQGLYWRLDCRCELLSDRVERVYCGGLRLGVLAREGDCLTLHRRISKASAPGFPPPEGRLSLEPDGTRWEGSVLGCPLPPCTRKQEGGNTVLCFPYAPDRPFPSMALFCFFSWADGQWQLTLDQCGNPVFPGS